MEDQRLDFLVDDVAVEEERMEDEEERGCLARSIEVRGVVLVERDILDWGLWDFSCGRSGEFGGWGWSFEEVVVFGRLVWI